MPRVLLVALLSLLALPAAAEPVGYRYAIHWGGFRAGEMTISREDGGASQRVGMSIHTVGLFDTFLRLRFAAESTGRHGQPERYQTHYRNRREERTLTLDFHDGAPGEPQEVQLAAFSAPDQDEEVAPPVPPELRAGSLDPLTAVVRMGGQVKAAMAGEGPRRFTLANFDGHRRYDFAVEVKGRERLRMGEREFDTVAAEMVMLPLAGFKPRFLSMWQGASYLLHFDPATGLPLRVETHSFTAPTVVTMVAPLDP